ncbi:hypothetical protein KDK95_30925 [Actinospica sp. MGRD01-02]|uniref:Uncharacterized protein n=1 Tax=Actinospica acidithermotolerans TaxID=2828514 RepID=A0A941IM68_9ACTN|nr:hypothetical protein [Actinospica acidithermotolerans]MBR7830757.1 hypothetical protein [Actinospica acidithermotolerans]
MNIRLLVLAGALRDRLAPDAVRAMTVCEQWEEIKSRLDARCEVVVWMEEDLGPDWAAELDDGLTHVNPYAAVAAYERAFARRGLPQTWLAADGARLVARPARRTVALPSPRRKRVRSVRSSQGPSAGG